nr:hypothetical protein [Desulfobacula sp.]
MFKVRTIDRTVFLTLLISFLMLPTIVEASIVYSGKLNLTGPDFNLDLNGDGTVDFSSGWTMMISGNLYGLYAYTAAVGNMEFINNKLGGIAGSEMPGFIVPLDYGILIGPIVPKGLIWSFNSNDGMMWTSRDFYSTPMETYSGIWNDVKGKYLGFKLIDWTESFYGWIQFDTDSQNNITLIDYAYESNPNTAIQAGVSQVPIPSSLGALFSGLLIISYMRLTIMKRNGRE